MCAGVQIMTDENGIIGAGVRSPPFGTPEVLRPGTGSAVSGSFSLPPINHGMLDMTAAGEQQMLDSLSAIAQNINLLVTLVKALILQHEKADQQSHRTLSQIAHKR